MAACFRRNSAAPHVFAQRHIRCPEVPAGYLPPGYCSEPAASMLATLRNSDPRWFELRVELGKSPAANRAGEQWAGRSQAAVDTGCTPGRAGPPALAPR